MNLPIIIFTVALIVVVLLFIKFRHFKHRTFAILLILLLVFVYVTSTRVLHQYDLNLKSVAGIEKAVKVYFVWLGGAFDNLKVITGNAMKMDWDIKNKTAADKIVETG